MQYKSHYISEESNDSFAVKIETLVREIIIQNEIPYYRIESGVEHFTDAGAEENLPVVRVITYFEDTVNKISHILHEEFDVDIEKSVDKRRIRIETFAYKNINYTAKLKPARQQQTEYRRSGDKKFEIQICSMLQDAWTGIEKELGYDSTFVPDEAKRDFYRVGALLEMADIEFLKIRTELSRKIAKPVEEVKEIEAKEITADEVVDEKANTFLEHLHAVAREVQMEAPVTPAATGAAAPAPTIAEFPKIVAFQPATPSAPAPAEQHTVTAAAAGLPGAEDTAAKADQPAAEPQAAPVAQPVIRAQQPQFIPARAPVQQAPVSAPAQPAMQQPVTEQPIFTPPSAPVVAAPPPVQQPVVATPPPVQQPVVATPPPVQQPVVATPPPVQQPVVATPPPVQQPVVATPPPVQQPVVATPPPPQQPVVAAPAIAAKGPATTAPEAQSIAPKRVPAAQPTGIAPKPMSVPKPEQIPARLASDMSVNNLRDIAQSINNIESKPAAAAPRQEPAAPKEPAVIIPPVIVEMPKPAPEVVTPLVEKIAAQAPQPAAIPVAESIGNINVGSNGIIQATAEHVKETIAEKTVPLYNEQPKPAKAVSFDENAQMTDVSLREFVMNSKLVKEVDQKIAERAGAKINTDIDIEGDVERLRFLKVYTLKQLQDRIMDNKEDIVAFAEKWIGKDNGGSFDSGICLFYLEYLLVGKRNDPAFAVEYVVKFISDNDYSARYIIPTYNSIHNTEAPNFSHLTLRA